MDNAERPKINVDALHQKWFDSAESFAWKYLGSETTQTWGLVGVGEDAAIGDPLDYICHGKFQLPANSDNVMLVMARGALAFINTDPESLATIGIRKFPLATFCAPTLLEFAWPKSQMTKYFRNNIGTMYIGGFDARADCANDLLLALPGVKERIEEQVRLNPPEEVEPTPEEIENVKAVEEMVNFHAAFVGLGVLMLRSCRDILDPMAAPEDVIKSMREMFICRLDGNNETKTKEENKD